MQSEIIAMLVPEDDLNGTMLVRRADGQFAFARIDARIATAARVASGWLRSEPCTADVHESAARTPWLFYLGAAK